MKKIHRISINPNKEQLDVLRKLSIDIPYTDNELSSFITIVLDETSIEYYKIKPFIDLWELIDVCEIIFTKSEIQNSETLVYESYVTSGYPQPEENFKYLQLTYDITNYCKECGIGAIQKAPFRLSKIPKWNSKKMFELNWVFDEIFVEAEIYEQIFKPIGVEKLSVLLYKKETVIENTVQLMIPKTDVSLGLENQHFSICKQCERKKYYPNIDIFINKQIPTENDFTIYKSQEYFGYGGAAYNKIFFRQSLFKELVKHKINPKVFPTS